MFATGRTANIGMDRNIRLEPRIRHHLVSQPAKEYGQRPDDAGVTNVGRTLEAPLGISTSVYVASDD